MRVWIAFEYLVFVIIVVYTLFKNNALPTADTILCPKCDCCHFRYFRAVILTNVLAWRAPIITEYHLIIANRTIG